MNLTGTFHERLLVINGTDYKGYPHFSYVQPFESSHDLAQVRGWLKRNWYLSLYISAAYLIVVYCLSSYMKKRPPINIRKIFMFWNIALAFFSICGMCRGIPELLHVSKNFGIESSVCDSNFNSVTGFWISLFTFSKAIELVDTVFLILRKRLTFLHLIHHVIALLITWNLMADIPGLGRWTYTMNFTVHSFMYSYFALKASKLKVPEMVSFGITCLQILQFVIGFFTALYSGYVIFKGNNCSTPIQVSLISIIINGYFFYIFGKFFVKRYFRRNNKTKDD